MRKSNNASYFFESNKFVTPVTRIEVASTQTEADTRSNPAPRTENAFHEVNLDEYPLRHLCLDKTAVYTLGDMHGNTLMMLYFLMLKGVVTLSKKDYDSFRFLFDRFLTITTDDFTTKEKLQLFLETIDERNDDLESNIDINYFIQLKLNYLVEINKIEIIEIVKKLKKIIDKMIIHRCEGVRFIGDMLADRVGCDLFTLEILAKLKKSGVKVTILYSNHDDIFLKHFCFTEALDFEFKQANIGPMQAFSLQTLLALINEQIVEKENIYALLSAAYLPNLKLLDFSCRWNENDNCKIPRLYMHAPNGENEINTLMNVFGIDTNELFATHTSFAYAVRKLNCAFTELVRQTLISKCYIDKPFWDAISTGMISFVWTRQIPNQQIHIKIANKRIKVINGHDGLQKLDFGLDCFHIVLNGNVGKGFYDTLLRAAIEDKERYQTLRNHEGMAGFPCYIKTSEQAHMLSGKFNILSSALSFTASTGCLTYQPEEQPNDQNQHEDNASQNNNGFLQFSDHLFSQPSTSLNTPEKEMENNDKKYQKTEYLEPNENNPKTENDSCCVIQ